MAEAQQQPLICITPFLVGVFFFSFSVFLGFFNRLLQGGTGRFDLKIACCGDGMCQPMKARGHRRVSELGSETARWLLTKRSPQEGLGHFPHCISLLLWRREAGTDLMVTYQRPLAGAPPTLRGPISGLYNMKPALPVVHKRRRRSCSKPNTGQTRYRSKAAFKETVKSPV